MSVDAASVVLALNAGSSTLKFGLFDMRDETGGLLLSGQVDTDSAGMTPQGIDDIARRMAGQGCPRPSAIGHRIVHGGVHVRRHTVIDEAVMHQLHAAAEFAPLHVPAALALVTAAQARWPGVPQVACLDTAFHQSMPEVAKTLPVPDRLRQRGVERFGFHGLSCESVVAQLGSDVPPRLVIAHLGHGASVTAVADGRSIDTSMGLTPSGGVMMGTRTGDIDPGVLVYALRALHLDAAALEATIDVDSGMAGVSGLGGDMRMLRELAPSHPRARLAIAMFCYGVRKQIAAMAAALGGLDLLVFTGGIGENDAQARDAICSGLGFLGLHGDAGTTSRVRVLPAQEASQIAGHAWALACRPFRDARRAHAATPQEDRP